MPSTLLAPAQLQSHDDTGNDNAVDDGYDFPHRCRALSLKRREVVPGPVVVQTTTGGPSPQFHARLGF